MVKNPPEGMPQCLPNLFYDDLEKAVTFLKAAFGFGERFLDRNDGKLEHAQLTYGSAVFMLGPTQSPRALIRCRAPREAGSLNAGVYLYVDDVDAHCRRAREAGAQVLLPPTDMHWGDRLYCAVDPEGQFWAFATPTRDVPPAEM
jgi:uncharacterized glyoxalase superfamily protein PhnB